MHSKKISKNNNPAYFKERFIEKTRKKSEKKQLYSRCLMSKLHFDEIKNMPSISEFYSLQSETITNLIFDWIKWGFIQPNSTENLKFCLLDLTITEVLRKVFFRYFGPTFYF
jgi:hypothetical protein